MCEFISGAVRETENGLEIKSSPVMDSHQDVIEKHNLSDDDGWIMYEWVKDDKPVLFGVSKEIRTRIRKQFIKQFGSRDKLILQLAIEHCEHGEIPDIWKWNVDGFGDKEKRLFAYECAEYVLPIYEKTYPDDKTPREFIETFYKFIHEEVGISAVDAKWGPMWNVRILTQMDYPEKFAWNSVAYINFLTLPIAVETTCNNAIDAIAHNILRENMGFNISLDNAVEGNVIRKQVEDMVAKRLLGYLEKVKL